MAASSVPLARICHVRCITLLLNSGGRDEEKCVEVRTQKKTGKQTKGVKWNKSKRKQMKRK